MRFNSKVPFSLMLSTLAALIFFLITIPDCPHCFPNIPRDDAIFKGYLQKTTAPRWKNTKYKNIINVGVRQACQTVSSPKRLIFFSNCNAPFWLFCFQSVNRLAVVNLWHRPPTHLQFVRLAGPLSACVSALVSVVSCQIKESIKL